MLMYIMCLTFCTSYAVADWGGTAMANVIAAASLRTAPVTQPTMRRALVSLRVSLFSYCDTTSCMSDSMGTRANERLSLCTQCRAKPVHAVCCV